MSIGGFGNYNGYNGFNGYGYGNYGTGKNGDKKANEDAPGGKKTTTRIVVHSIVIKPQNTLNNNDVIEHKLDKFS